MGILRRVTEMRRRQVLLRRFGKFWGKRFFDQGFGPDFDAELTADGELRFPSVDLNVTENLQGLDPILYSAIWRSLASQDGLKFRVHNEVLLVEIDGITLFLEHANDYYTVVEVFRERMYDFEIPGEYVFVDIGANIGLVSLYLARHYSGPIYAFELVPSTAAQARRNIDLNPQFAARIFLNEYGISDHAGSSRITIDPSNSASNSMVEGIGREQVDVHFKDAVEELERIAQENPGRKLCVKLDAEGAEFAIMDRWHESAAIQKIDVLFLEWHAVADRDPDELRKILRKNGFLWFERAHCSEPVGFLTAWRKDVE